MSERDIDLNTTDELILAKLKEGRCTPTYLAEELNRDRSYINQRLTHLREAGIVDRVHPGLYKHVKMNELQLDAEEIVSRTDSEELMAWNDGSITIDDQPSMESRVDITGIDIQDLASNVNASFEEHTNKVESVLLDIYWQIINEEEISKEELKRKIPDIDNRLPRYDFDDYWKHYLKKGEELTKHPHVEKKSDGILRYTGEHAILKI